MELEALTNLVRTEVDEKVAVRVRRPGLYQLDLPAFLADGDAASIFVEEAGDRGVRVSDLGQTRTRASYLRKLDRDIDSRLERLARSQGFSFEHGAIAVVVPASEFLPAVLGLVQIEAQADESIKAPSPRGMRAEDFRTMLQETLRAAFAERCEADFIAESVDPERRFAIDAVIRQPNSSPVGVLAAPTDLEAERAIGTKLKLAPVLANARWIAVPRDITKLGEKTQKRLMSEFLAPVPEFERSRGEELAGKSRDLAA